MFQCYSLKSSHIWWLCLLPQSPKVCSLHRCLFCCLACRIIITVSINSIYMHEYTELVFLWLTSLCMRLQFHPLILTDSAPRIPVYSWVTVHCVYVPQLPYPFICQQISRLLPCPGYCKQCCDEHWGTRVSFNSSFLSVYAQQWDCWVVWQFYFQFFKESPHCSPFWLYQFAFSPTV